MGVVVVPGGFDLFQVDGPFGEGVDERGEAALPAIDPADIAEVAATVLRDPGHTGTIYTLTGPEPISPRQQAAAIAVVLNEPVQFAELTRAQARDRMVGYMPEPVVEATLDVLGTPLRQEQEINPDVEKVLGRPGRTFADWVTRKVEAFR